MLTTSSTPSAPRSSALAGTSVLSGERAELWGAGDWQEGGVVVWPDETPPEAVLARRAERAQSGGDCSAKGAFALILALRCNLLAYREDTLAGEWQKSGQFCFFNHPINDLAGAQLGIIGEGALGPRVAEIAKILGMGHDVRRA